MRYNVLVKKGAAFEAEDKTLTNVAEAVGSNGRGRADDNVILKPNERPEDPNEPGTIKAVKTANKDTVDLTTDPRVTYSVTMVNNDTKPWENVKIVDVLDTTYLHLYKDSVKLNGKPLEWGTGYTYKATVERNDTLTAPIGTLEPGQAATLTFDVRFENDVYRKPGGYTNMANVTSSSHDPLNPEHNLTSFANPGNTTGIHYPIFVGYVSQKWRPGGAEPADNVTLQDAASAILRALPEWKFKELSDKPGKDVESVIKVIGDQDFKKAVSDSAAIKFMICIGALGQSDFSTAVQNVHWQQMSPADGDVSASGLKIWMTRDQFGRMLDAVGLPKIGGEFISTNPLVKTTRIQWAGELNRILGRDASPDINGHDTKVFTDVTDGSPYKKLVSEVSTYHNYVLKADGSELWTISDTTKGPWKRP